MGGIVGNYIFGYLQDTLGRKPAFFIYLLIECVFGVATAFAQNYVVWLIYRIGVGFTVPAIMATPYVLGELIVFWGSAELLGESFIYLGLLASV